MDTGLYMALQLIGRLLPTREWSKEDLRAEPRTIEEMSEQLCWKKVYEKGVLAIFGKKINAKSCRRKSASVCESMGAEFA